MIVGPTAAGKTELGVQVAHRLSGEVVSADAFAVYRGLDIGTAKPNREERAAAPHHLIDIADPHDTYSAGMFVRDADRAISEIRSRGRVPVVVGGTLFYVRALLFGLFAEPRKDPGLRVELEREWATDPEAVRRRLAALDPESSERIPSGDRQRILRAIEVSVGAGRPMSELWREQAPSSPRYRFCLLCTSPPRDHLRARIEKRVDRMFEAGLVEEVRGLLDDGVGAAAHAMKAIGYRQCCRVVKGKLTQHEAMVATVIATRQLAKRQFTWLRGEESAVWLKGWGGEAADELMAVLEASGGPRTGQIPS